MTAETPAEKVARLREEQGLPADLPASVYRALADHVKAAREHAARQAEREAS